MKTEAEEKANAAEKGALAAQLAAEQASKVIHAITTFEQGVSTLFANLLSPLVPLSPNTLIQTRKCVLVCGYELRLSHAHVCACVHGRGMIQACSLAMRAYNSCYLF